MRFTLKNLIGKVKKVVKSDERFFDAFEAYQVARYNDRLTRDQLKEIMIEELKKRITHDFRESGKFLDITTYDRYREKHLLPEIADYFRELKYHVDLLNTDEYQDVNVLIINWQNLETIR